MAAVATLLTSGSSVPGVGSTVSSSITPANNSLLVVIVGITDDNAGDVAAAISADGGGWTYTARVTAGLAGGFKSQGRIFTAPVATGASMQVTLDCGANDLQSLAYFIVEVTGYDTGTPTGATASDTSGMAFNGADTITLSGAPATTSIVLASVTVDGDSSGTFGVTPGADFNEMGETGSAANIIYGQVQQRTASTSTSVAWVDIQTGTMTTFSACGMALEILAASGSAPSAPTITSQGGGHQRAGVQWTAGSDGGSAVTSWDIDHATAAAPTTWLGPVNTASTNLYGAVTGLTNSTAYVFRVRGVNAIGNGTWSSTSGSATPSDVRGNFLLEDGTSKFLLEDGTSKFLLESGAAGTPGVQFWGIRMR